jgi:hypothetical protein
MYPYGESKNIFLFCFILIFCFLEITACGINEDFSTDSNHGTGTYAARLIFPPEIPRIEPAAETNANAIKGGIDCSASNISTIKCSLFSADNRLIKEASWPCSQNEGTLKEIPPGKDITVLVKAEDTNGTVLLTGEDTNVTIEANKQTEGDNIVMKWMDSPTVTAGDAPKTLRFDWSHIGFSNSVDHYQLQIDPDGESGDSVFNTVEAEGSDHIQETEFTLTISVHLTDWVNAIFRVVALDALGEPVTTSSEVDLLTTILSNNVIGYLKASNTDAMDWFGGNVALSADGNTLAVGASGEDSAAIGINQDENDNSLDVGFFGAGAVYVFIQSSGVWEQQAYIKASNTDADDGFGSAIALSADGDTLIAGAASEDSADRGINERGADNSLASAGAVYVFTRSSGVWEQQAYIKASNTDSTDFFGNSVALSDNGNILAVGAYGEDSSSREINQGEDDNSMENSGSVYIFTRNSGSWWQEAYIKASNADVGDEFGYAIALSADGGTLAVGADREDSAAIGIDGNEDDNSMDSEHFGPGAVYVFTRNITYWRQQAYIKASNTDFEDAFGGAVALSGDGNTLAVGAIWEDSAAIEVNGDEADNSMGEAGAVYVFMRSDGIWEQQAYVKPNNTDYDDHFGYTLSLSVDGNTLAVGAYDEDSEAKGINGDGNDNSLASAGAVYVFTRDIDTWRQRTYVKANNSDAEDRFGYAISLSADGSTMAVGAHDENSAAIGVGGDETDNSKERSGAVYLY